MNPHRRTRQRAGSSSTMVLIAIPVLVGFSAISLDVSVMMRAEAQLANAVDAAALAGASAASERQEAIERAMRTASANEVWGEPVSLSHQDITLGVYRDGVFTRTNIAPNAVRVTHSTEVPLYFAWIFGWSTVEVHGDAIAYAGVFDCDILGDQDVNLHGQGQVDAWASCEDGPYAGPTQDVAVCSNGTSSVGGDVVVLGDAHPGPGEELVVSGTSAVITGSDTSLPHPVEMPNLNDDLALVRTFNDNATHSPVLPPADTLRIGSSDEYNLGPGVFYTTGVSLTGTSTLNFIPPVELWIDGQGLKTTGDTLITTPDGDPRDVTIYVMDGPVDIHGTAHVFGSIIAPDSSVDLMGDGALYGVVIGDDVEVGGNTELHVDTCLELDDFGFDLPNQDIATTLVNAEVGEGA